MNRWTRLGLATSAVAVLGLTACAPQEWPQVGYGPEHQRWNQHENKLTSANASTLQESWSVPVDNVLGEPIVQDGRVFVTDYNGGAHVRALTATSGAAVWERRIDPSGNEWGTPSDSVIVGGKIMATWRGPDCTGGEVRLDPSSGAIVSQSDPGMIVRSTPVPANGKLAQYELHWTTELCNAPPIPPHGVPNDIAVRDAASGEILWQANDTMSDELPAVGSGYLVVGFQNIAGYKLDGCGAQVCDPLWKTTLNTSAGSDPMIVGNTVFASRPGELVAVDIATGTVRWTGPTETYSGKVVYADGIVYNSAGGRLFAWDADGCAAATCTPMWSVPIPHTTENMGFQVVAAAGGLLYLTGFQPGTPSDGTGRIIAIDPSVCSSRGCDTIWDSGTFVGRPDHLTVAEGRVFVQVHRDDEMSSLPDLVVSYAPAA